MEVHMEKRAPEVSPDEEVWTVEGTTPEVSPDPRPSTSLRSSSSSSSLFSSFRVESFDFSGYPPQSELEEVPSFRWLPDGLRLAGTFHSNREGNCWSGKSTSDSLATPTTKGEILSSSNLKAFMFDELRSATRNFRPSNLLGRGWFGYAYKGWIDEHTLSPSRPGLGIAIAVKILDPEGFHGHKEWLTEVQYLGQLHHPNLVKIIGYCSEGDNQVLVCEFMPKGSLEDHLFKRSCDSPLSWATRIKVAIGVARGLSFLHDSESQVTHRNVMPSNILLDAEFNAKLSDYGLATTSPTSNRTQVSTDVMGTHGYAAPEYIATGHLTAMTNVYSFGVVLLELLSGQRALDTNRPYWEQNRIDWGKRYLGDKRKLLQIIDPRMEGQYPQIVAFKFANLALQCLCNDSKLRPRMSTVLATLEQLQVS